MKPIEFATLLAEWRARNGYTDREAAAAIGTRYGAFLHWLHGEYVPGYFALVAVLRQIRDGRDPLVDASLKPAEFAAMLTSWRERHGFTQRQAAIAIGCEFAALQSWEQQEHVPQQPALAEIVRRLRMPVDAERVKAATRKQPVIEKEKFAELFRQWRKRHRLTRDQAAAALRSVTGLRTTGRTVWCWETARELPRDPLAVLEKIHGELASNPPKPKPLITPERFGRLLREWRKRRGLNQLAAAAVLDVGHDQAKISNWEKGKSLPRKPVLMRLLAKFKEVAR